MPPEEHDEDFFKEEHHTLFIAACATVIAVALAASYYVSTEFSMTTQVGILPQQESPIADSTRENLGESISGEANDLSEDKFPEQSLVVSSIETSSMSEGAGGSTTEEVRGGATTPQESVAAKTLPPEEQMMNFINQFPPGILACVRERIGEEGFVKMAIEGRTPELEMAINACSKPAQIQSRKNTAPQQFLGATITPFVVLWGLFR